MKASVAHQLLRRMLKHMFIALAFFLTISILSQNMAFAMQASMETKEIQQQKPLKWSLQLKGGRFEPAFDDWETYFGNDYSWYLSTAIAYKFIEQLDTGIELGWIKDNGAGFLPANNTVGGNVRYQLFPLHVFVVLRGAFTPKQWLVPYAGGGWTRLHYKQKIQNQESIDGAETGTHTRAGIQILINNVNKKSANYLRKSLGIVNSYFFLEAMDIDVETRSTNVELGGKSYFMGFSFEF